ncbi:MAG: DsrE family protein [Actinomycetota bacterium]
MSMTETTTDNAPAVERAADDKVLVALSHGPEEPENVLIAYLMAVEAVRAGKETAMWLTKDGVTIAEAGAAETVVVDGAPSISALHDEYVAAGGRFLVCPVCVKLRNLGDAIWSEGAEVAGAPSVYEFADGGALVFNY